MDRMEVSEESSTNSSVDYDDDEEEPIDYEEEDELIDSDFLTLGSFGPKEDVLEPVPQDEEEGFFTPDKNDSNVRSNVSSMLKVTGADAARSAKFDWTEQGH